MAEKRTKKADTPIIVPIVPTLESVKKVVVPTLIGAVGENAKQAAKLRRRLKGLN